MNDEKLSINYIYGIKLGTNNTNQADIAEYFNIYFIKNVQCSKSVFKVVQIRLKNESMIQILYAKHQSIKVCILKYKIV